jgi:aminotransferase
MKGVTNERSPSSALGRALAARVPREDVGFRTQMLELAAGLSDFIALGRGDPDLPTPTHILAAAKTALDSGATHYTHPAGDLTLRQAIADHLLAATGLVYDPATEVLVTLGAQEAVYLAFLSLVEPGDEVLLPSHRFTSYDAGIELCGGQVRTYSTLFGNDYRLDPATIEAAVTPRTKAISIVSPDNPTGGVATPEAIATVARIARNHDLLVVSDEIYDRFVYDDARHVSIASEPGMRERTLIVNGFSKCYAMTGWRVGYLAGPADFVRAIIEVKHTLTICTPAVSQAAALAALQGPQDCIAEMREIYAERRTLLMSALDEMGLPYVRPDGAFYVYVDITSTGKTSPEFCLNLLRDTGVMIFPGTMFGNDGERHVRMSLLASLDQIREAARRMGAVIAKYQQEAAETRVSDVPA